MKKAVEFYNSLTEKKEEKYASKKQSIKTNFNTTKVLKKQRRKKIKI